MLNTKQPHVVKRRLGDKFVTFSRPDVARMREVNEKLFKGCIEEFPEWWSTRELGERMIMCHFWSLTPEQAAIMSDCTLEEAKEFFTFSQ